jgi:hypothetical protein
MSTQQKTEFSRSVQGDMAMNQTPRMVLLDSRSTVGSALMFWALGGGYTSNIKKAEVFSVDDAHRQYKSRPSDIPLRLDYLDERKERMVDCQNLETQHRPHTVEKLVAFARDTRFFAVVRGQWDGNAVYFVSREGGVSTDVDKARLFAMDEARLLLETQGHQLWPQEHIESLAYWRIPERAVDRKQALKDTGIELIKPLRPRLTYRCDGCGRFCTPEAYYTQSCSCTTRDY